MNALSHDLMAFFHKAAPKGINFLPESSSVAAEFRHTNLDFLARVGQWSAHKLAQGDSILTTIPFNQTHAETIFQTYRAAADALTKQNVDSTLLQQLPTTIAAMRAVTTHYTQKITAAEFMCRDAKHTKERITDTVEEAVARLDMPRLRVFFSHAASTPDGKSADLPALDEALHYALDLTLSKTLDDIMTKIETALGMPPETTPPTHYKAHGMYTALGKPPILTQCEEIVLKCENKIFFNRVISKDVTTYTNSLAAILVPRGLPPGPGMT